MPRRNTAELIVEEATELFRDNGYFGTSMNDIANRIGLKKASLYNHFDSKEEIAKAVIQKLHKKFQEQVFNRLNDKTMDAQVRLSAVSSFLQNYYRENPSCVASALSMGAGQTQELPRKEIQAFTQQWRESLCDILQTRYDQQQARSLADQSLVKLQGVLVVMRMEGGGAALLDQVCNDLKNLLR